MSSLGNVHAKLIARMRLHAHRVPGPGVTFSAEELIERSEFTHKGIASLASDVRTTVPVEHPLFSDFFELASQWIKFRQRLQDKEEIAQAAEAIDEFDRRYRIALRMYRETGLRPSYVPPESYRQELAALHKDLPSKPLPLGKLAAFGGGAVALFFWLRRNKTKTEEPDLKPIRVGPPPPLDASAPPAAQ